MMVLELLSVILAGSVASAWLFRRQYGWQLAVVSFIASLVLFGIMIIAASTGSAFAVMLAGSLFGAAIGAGMGGFAYAATERAKHDNEFTFIILAVVAVNMVLFTLYVMVAGYNFQWCGNPLFIGLFILISIGVFRFFLRIGRTMELFFGAGASFFLFIMIIASVNGAVDQYSEINWGSALEIILDLFTIGFCFVD